MAGFLTHFTSTALGALGTLIRNRRSRMSTSGRTIHSRSRTGTSTSPDSTSETSLSMAAQPQPATATPGSSNESPWANFANFSAGHVVPMDKRGSRSPAPSSGGPAHNDSTTPYGARTSLAGNAILPGPSSPAHNDSTTPYGNRTSLAGNTIYQSLDDVPKPTQAPTPDAPPAPDPGLGAKMGGKSRRLAKTVNARQRAAVSNAALR